MFRRILIVCYALLHIPIVGLFVLVLTRLDHLNSIEATLADALTGAGVVSVVYYLILQIVRMVVQYVVVGKFRWHPYKSALNDD